MKFINFIDKIIYHWHYSRLNIIKTLIFNFRTMPFKIALKLPVFLYGKIGFYFLQGDVIFEDCKIKRGMVKMGMNKEYLGIQDSSLFILNKGSKMIFKGTCEVSSNFLIRVGTNAQLKFGSDCYLGSSSKVVCINKITLGKFSRIAFESQLIDSDFHYTYSLDTKAVKYREKEIFIGDYNWVGNRTTISKGARTSSYTIVAGSSILNKDYTNIADSYAVLAGQPAKLVSKNIRRIYSPYIEDILVEFFKNGGKQITEEMNQEIIRSFETY